MAESTMRWHRQYWEKVGDPYPDGDWAVMVQRWECLVCGARRELYDWVVPRSYWHGHRAPARSH